MAALNSSPYIRVHLASYNCTKMLAVKGATVSDARSQDIYWLDLQVGGDSGTSSKKMSTELQLMKLTGN